jgi:hypothetical protein
LTSALDVGPSRRGRSRSETRMDQSRELSAPCTPFPVPPSDHVQLAPIREWLRASAATIASTRYPSEPLRLLPRDGCFPDRTMAQRPEGNLWFGGESGLFRFDGIRSSPWQAPAGQHLPDKNIYGLTTKTGFPGERERRSDSPPRHFQDIETQGRLARLTKRPQIHPSHQQRWLASKQC